MSKSPSTDTPHIGSANTIFRPVADDLVREWSTDTIIVSTVGGIGGTLCHVEEEAYNCIANCSRRQTPQ